MVFQYDHYKSILICHKDLNKDKFLGLCGTKRGFSEKMFTRIYECIFSQARNVQLDYREYYEKEYETFGHFLYHKLNLTKETIDEILRELQNKNYVAYSIEDGAYGDYGLSRFIFSETMEERILKALKMEKPILHED